VPVHQVFIENLNDFYCPAQPVERFLRFGEGFFKRNDHGFRGNIDDLGRFRDDAAKFGYGEQVLSSKYEGV